MTGKPSFERRHLFRARAKTAREAGAASPSTISELVMREITLEVQGRCGDLLKLQVTTDTTPMLRLTLPALGPSELSSPAASFLRLNRDPANNVLHFLGRDDWIELEATSRGGRIAVAGSACWRRELGGKAAYLARRRALFRVSRAFEVGLNAPQENIQQSAINRASAHLHFSPSVRCRTSTMYVDNCCC